MGFCERGPLFVQMIFILLNFAEGLLTSGFWKEETYQRLANTEACFSCEGKTKNAFGHFWGFFAFFFNHYTPKYSVQKNIKCSAPLGRGRKRYKMRSGKVTKTVSIFLKCQTSLQLGFQAPVGQFSAF